MKYEETTWFSERLGRNMRIKVYGHYGPAFIAFPCQNGNADDWYNNGMIDALSWFLENGKIKLFCIESNDDDKGYAGYKLEMFHQYLVNEVLPFVYDNMGGYCEPYLVGCSMGASHAANNFFKRPDLFGGFIALSGKYDISWFFDGYMNHDIYNNSPNDFLRLMPYDHPYIEMYNQKPMFVVVGKGRFEFLVSDSNYELADIAREKGINIDFNFWDENSVHDWESWHYQMPYFISKIIE